MPRIQVTPGFSIDEGELSEEFVTSPGPGGQNVNKVATAVRLRFDASRSASLPQEVLARLRSLAGSRMTEGGVLVISAHRHRTREANRLDARGRLASLVARAFAMPKPRIPTRPPRAVKERRLESKRRRSQGKQLRGPVRPDDLQ